jgi:hypothetical protein
VLWNYLRFSPLVPVVIVALRWRTLHSRFAFFLFALAVSAGIQFLWDAMIAFAEYLVFGAMYAHPRTTLWAFLRFGVPLYVVPLVSLAVVWLLSQKWKERTREV